MRRITYRRRALSDLDSVYDYTKARWGSQQAKTYLRQITSRIEEAAADMIVVRRIDDIGVSDPSLLRVRAGRHIVFFLRNEETLFVVRILHERMDLPEQLG